MDTPERLKTFEYVTAEKAPLYQAVMRAFMDSKDRFALHLRPTDVLTAIASRSISEHVDLQSVEVLLCDGSKVDIRPTLRPLAEPAIDLDSIGGGAAQRF